MSTNNEKIKQYIDKMVQAEVKRLLPDAVRQVLQALIGVAPIDVNEVTMLSNSGKRQNLQESTGHEEYPSMQRSVFDRAHMADLMGYGEFNGRPTPRAVNEQGISGERRGIVITEMMAEGDGGLPIPIDPSKIDPAVQRALSRDYTEMVRSWNKG